MNFGASASEENIFGAERSPNGRDCVYVNLCSPSHAEQRSVVCADQDILNVCWTSTFASLVNLPSWRIWSTAMSTEIYDIEHSSVAIPSLMLLPSGLDKPPFSRLVRFWNNPTMQPAWSSVARYSSTRPGFTNADSRFPAADLQEEK